MDPHGNICVANKADVPTLYIVKYQKKDNQQSKYNKNLETEAVIFSEENVKAPQFRGGDKCY